MKTIAIIPARGQSKRIPRKNIKDFNGKPIIYYAIKEALKVFDKVVVTTEDAEIKGVAKAYGAEVYDRPVELADDFTPAGEVVADCLSHYKGYGIVACVYPTAVFATAERLKKALEMLLSYGNEVFPVIKYSHPIQRSLDIVNGYIRQLYPKFSTVRTQDCLPRYHDAGQFYVMKVKPFMREKNLFMKTARPIIIDENEVQDIDTLDDWKLAETKYKLNVKT